MLVFDVLTVILLIIQYYTQCVKCKCLTYVCVHCTVQMHERPGNVLRAIEIKENSIRSILLLYIQITKMDQLIFQMKKCLICLEKIMYLCTLYRAYKHNIQCSLSVSPFVSMNERTTHCSCSQSPDCTDFSELHAANKQTSIQQKRNLTCCSVVVRAISRFRSRSPQRHTILLNYRYVTKCKYTLVRLILSRSSFNAK